MRVACRCEACVRSDAIGGEFDPALDKKTEQMVPLAQFGVGQTSFRIPGGVGPARNDACLAAAGVVLPVEMEFLLERGADFGGFVGVCGFSRRISAVLRWVLGFSGGLSSNSNGAWGSSRTVSGRFGTGL